VWLAGSPTGDAESPALGSNGAIPDDQRNVTLDRGHGASCRSAPGTRAQSDSMMVIDPLGRAYTLSGGPVTLDKLGYDPAEAPLVPDEWTGLFDEGWICRRVPRCAHRPTSRGSRSRRGLPALPS
jgi:hypothetical protein